MAQEPGQGRRVSRPSSILGGNNAAFDLGPQDGSQRSSLFPWDNAGASSSNDAGLPGSENFDVDVRMSHRDSSITHSQQGSIIGGIGVSPAPSGRGSQVFGEDVAGDGN